MLLRNLLPDPLMRPGLVEVEHIRVEHPVEVLLMQDEQMIEAFTPHASEKSFTGRIHARSVIRYGEHLDVTRLRNTGEVHPELAIIITDEVLRPLAISGGFPHLLCGPSVGGKACHADVDHSAGFQFDNEEGEQRVEEEIRDWEEVAGPDLLSMSV